MYMTCKCGSKHFLVDIVNHDNDDDSYEFICAGCGEFMVTHTNDPSSFFVEDIDSVKNGDESICLEFWVINECDGYIVALYKSEDCLKSRLFVNYNNAEECYRKCTDLFDSLGRIDVVLKLFDD